MGISLALLGKGLAGVVAGLAVYVNLPARFLLPVERATLEFLSSAPLKRLNSSPGSITQDNFQAGELWKEKGAVIMAIRRPGCVLCREEGAELSTLKSELDARNINLYGVVHEELGVQGFQPYFKGQIFLDLERKFYGPKERWMGFSGFARLSVWRSILRAKNKQGLDGNLEGEGRLLGGVFVIGAGDQGIIMEYREAEWGDHADVKEVMEAVKNMTVKNKTE